MSWWANSCSAAHLTWHEVTRSGLSGTTLAIHCPARWKTQLWNFLKVKFTVSSIFTPCHCALCEWQLHKLYNICSIVNYEFILMYTIITLLYGPITCHIILSHYDRKLSKIWTRLILNMWPGENRGFTNILWSVNNWHKDHTNVYWPSDVSMGLSYVTISE